jgi:hypothetical protein
MISITFLSQNIMPKVYKTPSRLNSNCCSIESKNLIHNSILKGQAALKVNLSQTIFFLSSNTPKNQRNLSLLKWSNQENKSTLVRMLNSIKLLFFCFLSFVSTSF